MGSRLVPVESAEQMLGCWEAGVLLFCMEENSRADDPSTYAVVDTHWSPEALLYEYNSETSWRKNEWRIRLED